MVQAAYLFPASVASHSCTFELCASKLNLECNFNYWYTKGTQLMAHSGSFVQECDATGDAITTVVWLLKNYM